MLDCSTQQMSREKNTLQVVEMRGSANGSGRVSAWLACAACLIINRVDAFSLDAPVDVRLGTP